MIDMSKKNPEIVGILSKTMNLFTYSLLSVIIKLSLSHIHTFQIIFLMNAAGFLLTSIILLSKKNTIMIGTISKTYLARGVVFTLGIITWISAIKFIPITEATAISYLTPIMAGLFGTVLFKEKFNKHILFSLLLSIIGMIIILKPSQTNILAQGVSLALLSAISWAVHDVIVKLQTRTESWLKQSHTMFFMVSIFTLPMALYVWQPVEPKYILLSIVVGILSVINKFFLVKALSKTNLIILAPITFLRLVFTSAMAYVVFGEIIDIYSITGVIVIIYSTLLMIKSLRNKRFY